MPSTIDLLRVTQDAQYAAALTPEQWSELGHSPEWLQMVAEQRELVASTLETHAASLPGYSQVAPPATPAAVLNGPYTVVGQKVPRVHGIGVVTGLGQYT